VARRWLFLASYAASGLAALVYEISWTRLLTLHVGHTTAAASSVVAAFMCGLAGGSLLGGRLVARLTPRQSLYAYIVLESAVVLGAFILPFELTALTPVLTWAYRDGEPGALFPLIRLLASFVIVLVPALALGATFPVAARWFVRGSDRPGRAGGALYAANTAGAAVGALLTGFVLIPTLGISGTTLIGIAASSVAAAGVLAVARSWRGDILEQTPTPRSPGSAPARPEAGRRARKVPPKTSAVLPGNLWLAAIVVGLSGFATLMYEIAWIRVFSLVIGPTTYAVAATVGTLIVGLACGAALASWIAGRTRHPPAWLALTLAGTAIASSWTSSLAGGPVPRLVAEQLYGTSHTVDHILVRNSLLVLALILPTTVGLGTAFPLALALVGPPGQPVERRLARIYAINTLAAMAGSLVAGFVSIPLLGLEHTLLAVGALLLLAALIVVAAGRLSTPMRVFSLTTAAAALAMLMWAPSWNRELLSTGVYKNAQMAHGADLDTVLDTGTLLYYRDGAAATVSVKRAAGTLSLAIDGKVDASNSGDMLTQKALAHLPLLLHPNPRNVAVIGLGSGVTLASALLHPIERVDVLEVSPEVVEASRYFVADNRGALADPRTHLVLGDGRSHLLLSTRTYDIIISEPSNPWMAGVAALFTREFFAAARRRLAPGGIICQWAHTYNISDGDLRSIVATFTSVFPEGTMWMVGRGDVLLVASTGPLAPRLGNLEQAWPRPGVAADLSKESAAGPFAFWSQYVGGPPELRRYAAGAVVQTDDRMALEFSGPRALYSPVADTNAATLRQLLDPRDAPAVVRGALAAATAGQRRDRGAMMSKLEDYASAYQDYATSVAMDPADPAALDGLVRAAIATRQDTDAVARLEGLISAHPQVVAVRIALSKLFAASGNLDRAAASAMEAAQIEPAVPEALEQVASIFTDAGDAAGLDRVVNALQSAHPNRASAHYYAAVSRFIRGQFAEALPHSRQAIAIDPNYAAAYNQLGAIYASLGQVDAARQAFTAALALDSRDSATYTNLGLLELTAANRRTAAGYFADALLLDPGSAAAREGLAKAR
jgi:spermidine synthase